MHSFIPSLIFIVAEVELSNHVLGKGEFGVVLEVAALHVSEECSCSNCKSNRSADKQPQHQRSRQSSSSSSSASLITNMVEVVVVDGSAWSTTDGLIIYLFVPFRILFRDLKPENVGFDICGDMRLFDFGLAEEPKPKDLVHALDGFNATGLTGSGRYMAPEVVQCKEYGLSADVYSYSIVFWEVFSGQDPFPKNNLDKYFEHVLLKQKRPSRRSVSPILPKPLLRIMEDMWNGTPQKRQAFRNICDQLTAECVLMHAASSTQSARSQLSDRTSYLTNRSLRSRCGSSLDYSIGSRISRSGY
jgi:serine/threonine protein kinase